MNNMARTAVTIAAIALAYAGIAGAESYRSIRVVKTDGTSVLVAGEKNLSAKFADADMMFAVGENVIVSIPTDEVKRWELSAESKVESLQKEMDFAVDLSGNLMTVFGIAPGIYVRLHDLSGVTLAEDKASGPVSFDLSNIPSGVYILSCNGKSIKLHISK